MSVRVLIAVSGARSNQFVENMILNTLPIKDCLLFISTTFLFFSCGFDDGILRPVGAVFSPQTGSSA